MAFAYRHAKVSPGREIRARRTLNVDRLRVAVSDAGGKLPEPRQPNPRDESGRGLTLVAVPADDWGAAPRDGGIGKTVWFEFVHQSDGR